MGGGIVAIKVSAMETKQVARKTLLQAQNKNKALRNTFRPKWNEFAESECEFLDLETSMALWDVALHGHVARKEWSHSLHTEEFESDLMSDVEEISRRISTFDNIDGFCLTYFWRKTGAILTDCLLYTSPSPRDRTRSRMPSSA